MRTIRIKERKLLLIAIVLTAVLLMASRNILDHINLQDLQSHHGDKSKQVFIAEDLDLMNIIIPRDLKGDDMIQGTQTLTSRQRSAEAPKEYMNTGKKEDDIMRRFNKRRQTLKQSCIKQNVSLTSPQCEIHDASFNMKYVNESQLVYCAIEKTGSTFWKRILHIIGGWGNNSNPTSILSKDADSEQGGFQTLVNKTIDEMKGILGIASSIMFVRDPYTRLFSAWLDKFYSPNHYYWTNLAPLVLKSQRLGKLSNQSLQCAHDISFTEFVNFTLNEIDSKECVDGHFAPNFKHCLPCSLQFDFIGKYETLKEDTLFLLNHMNLSHMVTFDDFEDDATMDAIRDSTDWTFSQKELIEECGVTFYCALFKTWKRLQSRGLFSNYIDFPYKRIQEVENITQEEFSQVLLEAIHKSNQPRVNNNRKESIQQAFNMLPKSLLKRFMKVFELDFNMFDYEINPQIISEKPLTDHKYFENCPF